MFPLIGMHGSALLVVPGARLQRRTHRATQQPPDSCVLRVGAAEVGGGENRRQLDDARAEYARRGDVEGVEKLSVAFVLDRAGVTSTWILNRLPAEVERGKGQKIVLEPG